jgi:hypothetical protein
MVGFWLSQFMRRLGWVPFSEYRIVYSWYEEKRDEVDKYRSILNERA